MHQYRRLGDLTGQAQTHATFGVLLDQEERHCESLDHASEALRLFQQTGNRLGQAVALNEVGWDHIYLGDCQQAIGCCQRALELCEDIGEQPGQQARPS